MGRSQAIVQAWSVKGCAIDARVSEWSVVTGMVDGNRYSQAHEIDVNGPAQLRSYQPSGTARRASTFIHH